MLVHTCTCKNRARPHKIAKDFYKNHVLRARDTARIIKRWSVNKIATMTSTELDRWEGRISRNRTTNWGDRTEYLINTSFTSKKSTTREVISVRKNCSPLKVYSLFQPNCYLENTPNKLWLLNPRQTQGSNHTENDLIYLLFLAIENGFLNRNSYYNTSNIIESFIVCELDLLRFTHSFRGELSHWLNGSIAKSIHSRVPQCLSVCSDRSKRLCWFFLYKTLLKLQKREQR